MQHERREAIRQMAVAGIVLATTRPNLNLLNLNTPLPEVKKASGMVAMNPEEIL